MKLKSKDKRKQKNYSAKFYFDDSKESGIELRVITQEEQRAAYDELVVEEIDFARDPELNRLVKVRTPKFVNKELEEWIIDRTIVNWFGIFIDDKELECTKENKLMLMRDYEAFSEFYESSMQTLKEDAEKTFGGTSIAKNSKSMRATT